MVSAFHCCAAAEYLFHLFNKHLFGEKWVKMFKKCRFNVVDGEQIVANDMVVQHGHCGPGEVDGRIADHDTCKFDEIRAYIPNPITFHYH